MLCDEIVLNLSSRQIYIPSRNHIDCRVPNQVGRKKKAQRKKLQHFIKHQVKFMLREKKYPSVRFHPVEKQTDVEIENKFWKLVNKYSTGSICYIYTAKLFNFWPQVSAPEPTGHNKRLKWGGKF